jgi:RNA polymerase sigma factor (sigma-70 family)
MATSPVIEVIQHLRRTILLRDADGLSDGQLLEAYLSRRDETALAVLVKRHGAMVWGVCRRVLRSYHDAEDAFQATFLVLVRKAASIVPREMVGNWLHGVAHQTALKARATIAKRGVREKQVTAMPEPAVAEQNLWRDLQPLLDEELSRLPDKYRAVIVLCDLEGKTRKEAARQLGCPEGTVMGRLARARMLLAKRLARRDVTLSGGAVATVLTEKVASASVLPSVVTSTIKAATLFAAGQAATGTISVKVAALTEGVLKSMLLTKLKVIMGLMLAVVAIGGSSFLCWTAAARGAQPTPQRRGTVVAQNAQPAPRRRATVVAQNAGSERSNRKDDYQPKTEEEQAIQGVWTLVSAERDGKAVFGKDSVQLVVTNEFWIWKERGEDRAFTYKIDTKKSPKQIDLTAHNIKGLKGSVSRCIYEIDGDTLKVCESDQERPTKFRTARGSGRELSTYKRFAPHQAQEKKGKS